MLIASPRDVLVNKANLRDLIAATGLVILLKLDLNRRFFSPCDLEIWWMTKKTIGHLFYATLSFLHHFVAIGEYKLDRLAKIKWLLQKKLECAASNGNRYPPYPQVMATAISQQMKTPTDSQTDT